MNDLNDIELPIAVFVHLGPNLPKHLKLNLNRHLRLFPAQELVLITSHDQTFQISDSIQQFKVNCDELQFDLFNEMKSQLDFNFRQGFWKYTLQRFFAIGEFHQSNPNRGITHIESDVLLMPNFPWQEFSKLRKLAWLKVNSEIDVAAIVHFPNLEYTVKLLNEIETCARVNSGTNDMIVLHDSASRLRSFHHYLPSLTSQNAHKTEMFGDAELKSLEMFGGIFDPLNLGLWYFGQDPKNSFGLRTRYLGDNSHNLNPNKTRLKFADGILNDGSGTMVFSLHIHSKFLPLFGKNWEVALKEGLEQASIGAKKYSFHPHSLLLAFQGNRARTSIWQLLSLLPFLNRLRKFQLVEKCKNRIKILFDI